MKQKLYKLKMLTNKLWAVDTTNLTFAQRLDKCKKWFYKPDKDCEIKNYRRFVFSVSPPTDRVSDAQRELNWIFKLEFINPKKYA